MAAEGPLRNAAYVQWLRAVTQDTREEIVEVLGLSSKGIPGENSRLQPAEASTRSDTGSNLGEKNFIQNHEVQVPINSKAKASTEAQESEFSSGF